METSPYEPPIIEIHENVPINLVAAMIERARDDSKGLAKAGGLSGACTATTEAHAASRCAMEFLNKLQMFRILHPDADHLEIALEVLHWCQL